MLKTQAIGLAMAAAVVVLFTGCGGDEGPQVSVPDTEEAFLEEIREGALAAKSSVSGSLAANSQHAKIELETGNFEMGLIGNDQIAHAEMKVYNRGDAPLKISRVTTSCGCTVGQMLDPIIAPGTFGTLKITVDPARIPGYYANKRLTLFTNDPVNPSPTVDVVTHVQPELKFTPQRFNLAELPQGQGGQSTIRVRQVQQAPLEISAMSMRQNSKHLSAKFEVVPEEEWQVPGKREYDLTVTLAPAAPAGNYSEAVHLRTNVKRQQGMTILRFDATVLGVFNFKPAKVTLRNVNPGQSYESVLSLHSKEVIEILEITNLNKSVTVSHRPGDQPGVLVFDLLVSEAPDARLQRDRWTLRLNAGGREYTETIDVSLVMARQE